MTTSMTQGPALIGDLERDARQLADNGKVSDEQMRRTIGRIGLLLVDVARTAADVDQAQEIAVNAARKHAADAVEAHVVICRAQSGTPTSWRGAAMLALSKSPVAVAILIPTLAIIYRPPMWVANLFKP